MEAWRSLPIPEEDASWDLGDGVRASVALQQREEIDDVYPPPPPEIIYQVWTAAQVAATAVTLGQAAALGTRRWRKKEPELPPGTRLTLSVTLPEGDNQLRTGWHERGSASHKPNFLVSPAYITIEGADTKTQDELTNEIKEQLSRFVRHFDASASTDSEH